MRLIPNAISSKVALTALKISKQSPNILFGAGVVGVVATAVLASRATLKIEGILDDHEKISNQINGEISYDEYSDSDRKKDLVLLYTQTAVQITKLYGPALIVGGLSVAALTGSHHILTKRNAALTAAYAVLEKGFDEYRGRVRDDHGDEKEKEYYRGVTTESVVETSKDGKSAKITEKKTRTGLSPYGVIFNESNPNWRDRPELNLLFLRGVQTYANDKFQAQGYLFLSDVLDDLGFEQTKPSRVVGWHKKSGRDQHIDLGIFDDAAALRIWQYATCKEGDLYLDFNVSHILDLI